MFDLARSIALSIIMFPLNAASGKTALDAPVGCESAYKVVYSISRRVKVFSSESSASTVLVISSDFNVLPMIYVGQRLASRLGACEMFT